MLGALLIAALAAPRAAVSQAQLGFFGQNRIQYRNFNWKVLKGPHVDLFFYPEEEELARVALAYAEESFSYLQEKFGHTPSRRIPLIIYASHADFEQTNILPFIPPEQILGLTEFLKRRVLVPFHGNYAQFRGTLRHELVHSFQLSILAETARRYPGQKRPLPPLWWSEGLAEFWSAGEDTNDEMIIRALALDGNLPSFQQLQFIVSAAIVYPFGGALHRWLAQEFGEWRVQVLYRDLWKYRTFNEALAGVYGMPIAELNARMQHHFKQVYFPNVAYREPINLEAYKLTDLAVKPVAYRSPSDSSLKFLYWSPRDGYMTIYQADVNGRSRGRVVVKGQRTAEFESFHPFASRMDVRNGIAVFSSKYLERDALFFWDLDRNKVVGRYQFSHLVSILSPAWGPEGKSVVFSGLTDAGYSDLYRLTLPDGTVEQLTSDRYEDDSPSFSPDGKYIVFSSDRTQFGIDGYKNLFIMDLETKEVHYLTYGKWNDLSPRWAKNNRVYFTSDRDGVSNIYSVDYNGNGRKLTNALTGAFDPQLVDGDETLIYGAFADLTFSIFRTKTKIDTSDVIDFTLPEAVAHETWNWPELENDRYASAKPSSYSQRFSLDFAAGNAILAPGVGSAQGAVMVFSDFLNDNLIIANLTSFQGSDIGGFLDNVSGQVAYLNQKQRLNWGFGVFRLRGLFFEGDFETVFDESSTGGFTSFRYPFSRFSRVEGQLSIERSNRLDLIGGDIVEPRRIGWLFSNSLSFVHDNSLWLPTGPIDGQRMNVTAGLTNDVSNGQFDAWFGALDYRRYFRMGQQSALATRWFGYYAAGSRPRRLSIGGPLGLRGYPRIGRIAGSRAFLVSNEIRFPITHFLSMGFPFGAIRFPGIQGAIFTDVGGAWNPHSFFRRGVLGSAGLGLRMPLFFPIVLRLDFGYRFAFGETIGYGITDPSVDRKFVDFFVGLNY